MKKTILLSVISITVVILTFSSFSIVQTSEKKSWNEAIKKGWCVYTMQCYDTVNLNAMKKNKPTMMRWFVEWDRLDAIKNGKSLRQNNIDRCKPFFKTCADLGVTVIIQLWVKERFWEGDANKGVQWAKSNKLTNYPADIEKSYGSFLRDLIKAMKNEGIAEKNIIAEAWNEPDVLWGVTGDPPNYHEPWKVFDKKGFNKWTGGSGEKWKALHQVLNTSNPDVRWANGSVGIHERYSSWIEPCYKIEKITILDLHYYLWNSKTAKQYCDSVGKVLERWDKLLPKDKKPYPFFIGEINRYSSGTEENQTLTTEDAAMIRECCKLLYEKYGTRFLGVTAHAPIKMWKNGAAWYDNNYVHKP